MSFEDERIVKMTFDNKAFQKNIESTIRALERLDKSMKLEDVSPKAFDNFVDGIDETNDAMNSFDGTVNKVKASFSLLQIAGYTAMAELTRYAINAGKKIYANTLGQIKSGGLTRALNIESAKFQIAGLGHTWEEVAGDIDYAVKDTAYGLDSAAKAASQLLASEIKAGDQMKVSLRGISGLAAVTNSSYDDIADIFTTVAGNGRLMGDQLNRISYRGINAAQTLKDYFNNVKNITVNTEAEIRDMVSKGKVSFMDFAAAMDYAFGEHAKDANKTFTGAISNMKAALSRIGEKFFTPWNEFERRMALSVIPVINRVKDSLSLIMPVIEVILDRTATWTEKLMGSYNFQKSILNVVIGIWSWIQNIIGAFDELGFHLPTVENLADFLEKITSVLVLNADEGRKVRDVVKLITKSLSILVTILQAIWYAIQPIFKPILSFLESVKIGNTGIIKESSDIIDKINYIIKVIGILMHMGIEKFIKIVITSIKALIIIIKAIGGIITLIGVGISKLIGAIKIVVIAVRDYGAKIWDVIKSIGEGFEKFYNLVREIFINITTGMDTFLDSAKVKTSELWDVINNLVGTKKLTIDLGFSSTGSPNLKSFIPRGEASRINNAANAVDRYNNSVNEEPEFHMGGGASGSFQGMMIQTNVGDLIKFKMGLRDLGDQSRDVAEQIEQNSSRSADAFHNATVRVTNDQKGLVNTVGSLVRSKIDNAKENFWNKVLGVEDEKTIVDKAKSIFGAFSSGASFIANNVPIIRDLLVDHFTNFYAVVADVITVGVTAIVIAITVASVKIFNAFTAILNVIPGLVSALQTAAKGLKYKGMAEMFASLALVILSIGALILTIAIVTKICDAETFKEFISITALLVLAISALVVAAAFLKKATAVFEVLKCFTDWKNLYQKTMGITNNIKNLFISLAVLMTTVFASILIIRAIAEKDGGYAELYKAALFIAGIIAGISILMIITTRQFDGLGKVTSKVNVSLRGISKTTVDGLGGIFRFIISIIPLIAVIVGSVYLLSKTDNMGKTAAAFGLVMGSLILTVTTIAGVIAYVGERFSKQSIKSKEFATCLNETLRGIQKIIDSVSLFIFTISASAAILSLIPESKQEFVMKMLTTQLIAIAVLGAGIAGLIQLVSKKLNVLDPVKAATFGGSLTAISKIIAAIGTSLSALMLSIAGSLAIISLIRSDKLMKSVLALSIVMGVMTLVITVIISSMKSMTSVVKSTVGLGASSTQLMNNFGKELMLVLGAVSLMITNVTIAIGTLSILDTASIIRSSFVLVGIMAAMTLFVTLLLNSIRMFAKQSQSLSGGITQNVTGFAENAGSMLMQISFAMTLLIATLTSAIRVLGVMDTTQIKTAIIVFSITFNMLIGGVLLILSAIRKTANDIGGLSFNTDSFKFLYTMIAFIVMIAGATSAVIGSIALLASVLEGEQIGRVLAILGMLVVTLGALLGSIALITKLVKKVPIDTTGPVAQLSVLMMGMAVMMSSASVAIVALGIAAKEMQGASWKTILGAIASFVVIVSVMAGVFALIVKFAPQITAASGAIASIIPAIIALSGAILAISIAAIILGMVNWNNITANLKAFMVTIGALAVLTVVIAAAAALSSKAVIALAVLAGAIALIAGVILHSMTSLFEAYSQVVTSMNKMASLDWERLKVYAESFKSILQTLSNAVDIGTKNVAAAYLVGKGIAALAIGLSVLQTINPTALIAGAKGIEAACEALANSLDVVAWLAITIALIGGMLAPNLILMSMAVLLIMQLFPKFVSATDNAISAVASCVKNIETNIVTIVDSMKNIKDAIPTDELADLQQHVFMLAGLGGWMLVAGITLAVGTGAFLVGAALLMPAIALLKTSLDMLNELASAGTVVNGVDAMGLLFDFGILLIAASAILGIGVSIALPTFAILLGCIAMLCLTLAQGTFLSAAIVPMIVACSGLLLLSKFLLLAALSLILPAAVIGLACSFLLPALLLLAGTIGVIYLASKMDFVTILQGLGGVMLVMTALLAIGAIAMVISPILIVGLLGLTIASVLFMVMSSMILLGAASFAIALLAVWAAVTILDQIDFDGMATKLLQLGMFIVGIGAIGIALIVTSALLVIAGALMTVAAMLISVAMVTLAVSLLISAALLLASGYVLGFALEQLQTVFTDMEFGTLLLGAIELLIFGAVLGIAGLILLIGAALLLPGAIILTLGTTQLAVALPMLKKAFDKGLSGKDFLKQATLYLTSAALMLGAGGILMLVGPMILTFATTFSNAGSMIVNTIESLKDASGFIGDIVDSFADAGENIIDGITTGIVDNATDVIDSIEDVAEGVLDAFCDKLGINSPAREFIDRAAYCIAGIAEGLGMDHDEVYSTISGLGNGMLDKFDGFTSGFKSIGESFGDNMIGGFADSLKSGMKDISGGFLGDISTMLSGANSMTYDMQIKAIENQQQVNAATWGNNQWTQAQIDENNRLEEERKRLIKERDAMAVTDYEKAITDQMGNWFAGGSGGSTDIDYSMLDSATSEALGGSNLGKMATDASKVGGNVGTAITNNTYNFTQNNYSPEPIDRTELYTQTNNQLDTWYKWLRDNN